MLCKHRISYILINQIELGHNAYVVKQTYKAPNELNGNQTHVLGKRMVLSGKGKDKEEGSPLVLR